MGQAVEKSVSRDAAAQDTRTRILESAERVFAAEGFNGASMRSIAETAGVASGLLHYHFDNKRTLYASIVGWRAAMINQERLALLDALPRDRSLADILEALFRPALGRDAGGEAYARIMASMMTGETMHQELVAEHYDPTAQIFIQAIRKTGDFEKSEAAWGYNLAIHVLVAGMARSGRTERLAGEDGPASTEAFLEKLVAFAAGGVEQLAAERKS